MKKMSLKIRTGKAFEAALAKPPDDAKDLFGRTDGPVFGGVADLSDATVELKIDDQLIELGIIQNLTVSFDAKTLVPTVSLTFIPPILELDVDEIAANVVELTGDDKHLALAAWAKTFGDPAAPETATAIQEAVATLLRRSKPRPSELFPITAED